MRVLVIGGTGHIGTYLVPALVESGHETVVLARGKRAPYQRRPAWEKVQRIECDRRAEEKTGTFAARVKELKPDVVVDLICYSLEQCQPLASALRGQVKHFLHCGTIWIYGPTEVAPTPEDFPRRPVGEYGVRKAAIEAFLIDEARRGNLPATCVHPGHIVGPGWPPINPAGHVGLKIWEELARGDEVLLPDQGLATLHHVHAADVAGVFLAALANGSASVGECFHAVSPAALTLRGYAGAVAGWFGREAKLSFAPWDEWKARVPANDADCAWEHISRSPCASMDKARRLLGFTPRYTSLEATREALNWLIANGQVKAPAL